MTDREYEELLFNLRDMRMSEVRSKLSEFEQVGDERAMGICEDEIHYRKLERRGYRGPRF